MRELGQVALLTAILLGTCIDIFSWLEQALEQAIQGQDVAQILAETQRKAKVYVLCLESKGGFADEEAQKTCAEEADSR